MAMSREHIVFLSEKEIKDLLNLCRAGLKMAEDSQYFKMLEPGVKSANDKLMEKWTEIKGEDSES
jgi:hypothetical protein